VRLGVGLLEEVELELGAEHGRVAELCGALHLALQDLAGRRSHRLAVVPEDVAEDEGCPLEPRDAPQRGEVRLQQEVAVTALPVGHLVPGDRVHLHVQRKEVVAPLDAVLRDLALDEEVAVHALPEQTSLHIGESDDDGVDGAAFDLRLELLQLHAGDPNRRKA
jgi:hypothetical protein